MWRRLLVFKTGKGILLNQNIKRQTVQRARALCRCPSPASASVPGVKSASTPPATQHTHHDTVPTRWHSLLFYDSLFPLYSTENIVLFTFANMSSDCCTQPYRHVSYPFHWESSTYFILNNRNVSRTKTPVLDY